VIRAALAAAVLAALACVPALAAERIARVQVAAHEFNFALSKLKLAHGRVIVQLVNYGEDPHDLRLRRVGGTRVYRLAKTAPGEQSELTFRTLPGRYILWCSIADHRQRGMSAVLTVK
jgi:plastocyanin